MTQTAPGTPAARADWDPLDPAAVADPFGAHADLRERCPVARSDRWGGFWGLTRYEDIVAVALDTETFISGEKTTIPDSTGPGRPPRPPLEADRPEHTHYRRLLAPYFSAQRARELEPEMRSIAAELIDAAVAAGECDLVPAVALPMPALVLCLLLGLPADDWSFLKRSTTEVIEAGRAGDVERHAHANDAMYGYVHAVVEARRAADLDPRRDLITGLLQPMGDGRRLDDDQVTGIVRLLLQAGHNTTTNGLGSAFRHLGSEVGEQDRLRANPGLIPTAVDEILRAFSPAQFLARTVTREVELHGQTLCPSDKLGLFWTAANRDPDVFADPDRVDLARAPNRHVAFGYGIHRCIGAHLARTELCVAVEELLARTTRFELVGPAPEIGWPHIGPRTVPTRLH
ncbi:MAG TPA: cytochrome P450 [Solirubrobacteraceae bacterium]|jgi:cytochrome P450|nr:cytochrome P450 [Solirubrobacteraceae bacterium]